jgi:hypothetical protein
MSETDIVERLRKAASDFEAMRVHSANMEDSDCEPHWSDQLEMDDASKAAFEAADLIASLRQERDAIREATINEAMALTERLWPEADDLLDEFRALSTAEVKP